MPRLLIVLLVLVVATLACGLANATPSAALTKSVNERTVLRLINQAREQRGLRPVITSTTLRRAALAHSRDMLARDYFSHWAPSGASFATRASRAGYGRSGCSSWAVGEVLAWGSSYLGTPESTFARWMGSSQHRKVILSSRWRDVGVGCARGTLWDVPDVVVYTVDFGRRVR